MDKGQKIFIGVLAAILTVFLAGVAVFMATRKDDPTVGDFVPPPFETTAKTEFSEQPSKESKYTPIVAEEFSAAICGNVTVKDGKATVFFTSLPTNTALAKIKLFDKDGNLLGECGLIRPGEHVKDITLSRVPKHSKEASVKIYIYEPETYYSLGTLQLAGVNLILK